MKTLWTIALFAALLTASCTQVTDLSGTSLSRQAPAACAQQCQTDYALLQRQERTTHRSNLKACAGDKACRQAEAVRHAAAMKALTGQLQACKATCHKQGVGFGG